MFHALCPTLISESNLLVASCLNSGSERSEVTRQSGTSSEHLGRIRRLVGTIWRLQRCFDTLLLLPLQKALSLHCLASALQLPIDSKVTDQVSGNFEISRMALRVHSTLMIPEQNSLFMHLDSLCSFLESGQVPSNRRRLWCGKGMRPLQRARVFRNFL